MECLLCSSSFLQLHAVVLPFPWARVVSLLADGVRALLLFTISVPSAALPQNVPKKRPHFKCGGSFPLLVLSKTNIGLLSKQQLIREHMFPRSLTAGKQGQIEKPVGNPQPRCFQSACSLQCWFERWPAIHHSKRISAGPQSQGQAPRPPWPRRTSDSPRFSRLYNGSVCICIFLASLFPCMETAGFPVFLIN